ncbi:DUF4386 domain-containing protein [Salegentibacter chungangensis]|uniref:DUF4386 domain-containing protein n=1 Tax=Salegentibacter chungangensis TaxID=1335724 RepID=A0ABW3NT57_9FLAO
MKSRSLSVIAGSSYLIIFFLAIFANFFVLESILENPLKTVQEDQLLVRFGILAFILTVVFDVVVAWALFELYKEHPLSRLSTFFRIMHAAIMGVGVAALPLLFSLNTPLEILQQVENFNTIWLTGLFFFGIHLILLAKILGKPKWIAIFLIIAGIMYMADTAAHFLVANYEAYAPLFLALVAVPSIIGEMSLTVWLLTKGGRNNTNFTN